jgi:hypothetical protein
MSRPAHICLLYSSENALTGLPRRRLPALEVLRQTFCCAASSEPSEAHAVLTRTSVVDRLQKGTPVSTHLGSPDPWFGASRVAFAPGEKSEQIGGLISRGTTAASQTTAIVLTSSTKLVPQM